MPIAVPSGVPPEGDLFSGDEARLVDQAHSVQD